MRKSIALAFLAATLLSRPAAAENAPVRLLLWHMEQPPQRVARIQELINSFNHSHQGIQVRQEVQSYDDIYAKAPAAIAAGNGPDMQFTIPDFTPIIRKVSGLQSIKDFVQSLDAKHKFIASDLAPYSYDGGIWAVPLYDMAQSLWYRKSVLAAAGKKVPQTWSEWKDVVTALNKDGTYGIGLPANKQLYTDQTVYDFMVNNGAGELYNPDGTLRFDNPKTVAAYAFYKQLYAFSPPDAPSWMWGNGEACFASGSCAMFLNFSVITAYRKAGGRPEDLGAAPIPHADDQSQSYTINYSNGVMILSKDPAKRKAAETFIAWLLEPDNYGRFLNMEPGLFMPVTEDGIKSKTFWSDPVAVKYHAQIQAIIDNSRHGMLFGFTGGHAFPSISAISAQNLIAKTLQRIVIIGETPAKAVAEGQAEMQAAAKE